MGDISPFRRCGYTTRYLSIEIHAYPEKIWMYM